MKADKIIEEAYKAAADKYAQLGIDAEKALSILSSIPISIHCWQGDDVGGFERPQSKLSGGGIQTTGNYPGKARTIDELRSDLEFVLKLIAGKHRVNLHACYLDNGGKFVERDQIDTSHFKTWIDWAKHMNIALDFNPTFFSHPKADAGFTLSSHDDSIRRFWIKHAKACRKIAEQMGKQLGNTCINNFWIPDGYKDIPIDRKGPRLRLEKALDEIFTETVNPVYCLDSLEPKLFGIGSESYVVGSFEFYFGYAVTKKKILCLDTGHFHPTENVADKISSVLMYLDRVLIHISRPVRWDSDHVAIFSDELASLIQEVVRAGFLERVYFALDYFDASINRIAAWVIGIQAFQKALLAALLEPAEQLRNIESKADYTGRLAMLEQMKSMPFSSVWDYYCLKNDVPPGMQWLEKIREYENEVLSLRS